MSRTIIKIKPVHIKEETIEPSIKKTKKKFGSVKDEEENVDFKKIKIEAESKIKTEQPGLIKYEKLNSITKFDFKKVKIENASPYPEYSRPSPLECKLAVSLLTEIHGTPTPGERTMSVLDSLVRTILSQNTTDKNSRIAFTRLKETFPTWREVYEAHGTGRVEKSIEFGGLADTKAYNIHMILAYLLELHPDKCPDGEPSYEWLREMPTSFCKEELSKHKGVGPKTVSCVLMFNMQRAEFPVDTHVWFIAKKLGWVPSAASRETTYDHLNIRVPDEQKYSLHVLLVEHGKRCTKCAKGGKLQLPEEGACPLVNFNEKVRATEMKGGVDDDKSCHIKQELIECESKSDEIITIKIESDQFSGNNNNKRNVLKTSKKKLQHLDMQG